MRYRPTWIGVLLVTLAGAEGCCCLPAGGRAASDEPPCASGGVQGDARFCPPIGLGGRERCGTASCRADHASTLAALRPYPPEDRATLMAVPTRPVFGPPVPYQLQPIPRPTTGPTTPDR